MTARRIAYPNFRYLIYGMSKNPSLFSFGFIRSFRAGVQDGNRGKCLTIERVVFPSEEEPGQGHLELRNRYLDGEILIYIVAAARRDTDNEPRAMMRVRKFHITDTDYLPYQNLDLKDEAELTETLLFFFDSTSEIEIFFRKDRFMADTKRLRQELPPSVFEMVLDSFIASEKTEAFGSLTPIDEQKTVICQDAPPPPKLTLVPKPPTKKDHGAN